MKKRTAMPMRNSFTRQAGQIIFYPGISELLMDYLITVRVSHALTITSDDIQVGYYELVTCFLVLRNALNCSYYVSAFGYGACY